LPQSDATRTPCLLRRPSTRADSHPRKLPLPCRPCPSRPPAAAHRVSLARRAASATSGPSLRWLSAPGQAPRSGDTCVWALNIVQCDIASIESTDSSLHLSTEENSVSNHLAVQQLFCGCLQSRRSAVLVPQSHRNKESIYDGKLGNPRC